MPKTRSKQKTHLARPVRSRYDVQLDNLIDELLKEIDWDIYKQYDKSYAEVPEEVDERRDRVKEILTRHIADIADEY